MDRIDHALGRPLDPMAETYRNHYAAGGVPHADELAASPHWKEARPMPHNQRIFVVTDDGRRALAEHLRAIGDPHRAYVVAIDGAERTVIATSRSKARYRAYLDLKDIWQDLTFRQFCSRVSVRLGITANGGAQQ
jgi:hypothetical protein